MGQTLLLLLLTLPSLMAAVALAGDPPFSCGQASSSYAFCDAALPVAQRAADLVSRLTAAEKVAQLGDEAAGVPRLGVPGYKWWNEALHGLATSGKGLHFDGAVRSATSFPQVCLTAAAFDDDLWFRIGQAIGREARALYNLGQAEGLTMWSPNVNIYRDPRWGRGQETPGEDPTTASRYAVAFVRGMQGNSTSLLQASACCKHATAYDLEDWNGVARYNFDAKVTAQDLEDTFNPPFRSCVVDGKASCVMCAYTGINGVPACANADLLTKTVRGDWGLDGYTASDCDAVAIMRDAQRYAQSPEDAVALALKADILEKKLKSGYPLWWKWARHYQFAFHPAPKYCLREEIRELRLKTLIYKVSKSKFKCQRHDTPCQSLQHPCFKEAVITGCWSIWIHRNNIIFRNGIRSLDGAFPMFKSYFTSVRHKAKPSLKEGMQTCLDTL